MNKIELRKKLNQPYTQDNWKDVVDFETEQPLAELIQERSGWEEISAIKNDRLVGIDENIVSRIGPRVTDALKQFAEAIYPELYSE